MNDWSEFTKRITINAAKEDIYKAWATRSGIESWFLCLSEFTKKDGEIRANDQFTESGDRYLWKWYGYGAEVDMNGQVIEANGKDFIRFTFHEPMVVSVSITQEDTTNIVNLHQENIPVDNNPRTNYYVGCGEGWTFYLANLKSVLEGGFDLRNKNEKIKNVVNS